MREENEGKFVRVVKIVRVAWFMALGLWSYEGFKSGWDWIFKLVKDYVSSRKKSVEICVSWNALWSEFVVNLVCNFTWFFCEFCVSFEVCFDN